MKSDLESDGDIAPGPHVEGFHPTPRDGCGLYVHVPFCSAICPYCDFAVARFDEQRAERFVEALSLEIARWGGVATAKFDTVYFGGGTPSALSDAQLEGLCEGISDAFDVAPSCVWHLEVNPEDATTERVRRWRDLGFDFVSLGVQALDDAALKFLGRRHTSQQARRAIERCVETFAITSFDIIYSLPDTDSSWLRRTLHEAAAFGTQHLSGYELTFHEETPFGRAAAAGRILEPNAESRTEQFLQAHELLAELGMPGYEVSNFARDDHFQSPHNRKYWKRHPYLGVGPSAHSFDGARRWWNERSSAAWTEGVTAGDAIAGSEVLGSAEAFLEIVLLGLRTVEGLDLDALDAMAGAGCALDGPALARAVAGGLLERVEHEARRRLRPTLAGLARAESLAVELTALGG